MLAMVNLMKYVEYLMWQEKEMQR